VPCRRALALVVALLAVAPAARAGTAADPQGDADQQQFVRRYMAAVAAHDLAALVQLTHPGSRACMDETTREFFDVLLAREANHALTPSGFTIVSIAPAPAGAPPGTPPGLVRYPVLPTHEFQVEFATGPTSSTTLVRQIAPLDGAWYSVLACPTAEGLVRFRERGVQAREQRVRAEALAGEMTAPLTAELRALLQAGRRVEAVRRYREASGTDLTTAVGVIDVLSGRR
jgi:hypothetical protein